jgi:hypothetical protein|mmetsp:Transcript_14608/g.25820  ORF Transcript_14608/g.25820 Transcript_14608/m.25820 type:complete len:91 (+) Transcript_14608:220-492(+)
MARGLSREQSREKNLKKEKGAKTKDDGMTPAQRNERDAKMMAEKKAKKEAAKASGAISAEELAEEAKRKAKAKAALEERKYTDKARIHKK